MLGRPKKNSEADLTPNRSTNGRPALRLDGVSKSYSGVPAVDQLDLQVLPGEIVALLGPSGCGKTTTLRLVAGLETPEAGTIEIAGKDCRSVRTERRNTGFVFQDYALFPHLSVADNIGFGLARLTPDSRRQRIDEVLTLVGLQQEASRLPAQLSGGQQQRVALARAIAPKPALILLDEPLSNLDPQLRRHVRHEVVAIIRASGAAALWVTHDHDEGLIISDRVVVLDKGRLRQSGTPAEIWRSPADAWVAQFMGQGDFLSGTVQNGVLQTMLGPVRAPDIGEGHVAKVLVRPEDVVLDAGGCPGTVVRRHFSGSDNVYCVQLHSGLLLHCRQPSDVEIPRGTSISVKLASERLPVYA